MIPFKSSPLPNGGFVLKPAPSESTCWWDSGPRLPLPPTSLLDCKPTDLSQHHAEADRLLAVCMDLAERVELAVDVATWDATVGPSMCAVSFTPGPEARQADVKRFGTELVLQTKRSDVRFLGMTASGKCVVELPHRVPAPVHFGNIASDPEVRGAAEKSDLPWLIGRAANGNPLLVDLANDQAVHCLVSGVPGAGKSVALSGFLNSILTFKGPSHVRMILIDCKKTELDRWHGIRHLAAKPALYPEQAVRRLQWVKAEMHYREEFLRINKKRDIASYNAGPKVIRVPRLVVVVDELADLLTGENGKEVEALLASIARLGRATGIHLLLCTQLPKADIVTTTIRNVIPSRLVLRVATRRDSTTCCDRPGAETLAGRGECFALFPGQAVMVRAQCAWTQESDTRNLADFWRKP